VSRRLRLQPDPYVYSAISRVLTAARVTADVVRLLARNLDTEVMKKSRYRIATHLRLALPRLAESRTPARRSMFWQKLLAGAKLSAAVTQGRLTG
jgi:hypothetical protein